CFGQYELWRFGAKDSRGGHGSVLRGTRYGGPSKRRPASGICQKWGGRVRFHREPRLPFPAKLCLIVTKVLCRSTRSGIVCRLESSLTRPVTGTLPFRPTASKPTPFSRTRSSRA